jgi:hypothetical protein
MLNRRNTPRVEMNLPCTLSLTGRDVPCVLVDLSGEGALFKVAASGGGTAGSEELGLGAGFGLRTFSPARQYTGEMIRLFSRDGARFVALRFWKKYREAAAT